MVGEENIAKLLASMSPELLEVEYVFCTFKSARYGDYSELEPMASIQESEGLTLIIPKIIADEKNYSYESTFKKITLTIHSSLDAVGLTAAFAAKLTEHGISANVIAGYFHDHILVQSELSEKAIDALNEFSVSS